MIKLKELSRQANKRCSWFASALKTPLRPLQAAATVHCTYAIRYCEIAMSEANARTVNALRQVLLILLSMYCRAGADYAQRKTGREKISRCIFFVTLFTHQSLLTTHFFLTLYRAEVSTGYILPSRSNLHF